MPILQLIPHTSNGIVKNLEQSRAASPDMAPYDNCRTANTFLIWSGKAQAWWKADGEGYTKDQTKAGLYSVECLGSYRLDGVGNLDRKGRPTKCDVLVPAP